MKYLKSINLIVALILFCSVVMYTDCKSTAFAVSTASTQTQIESQQTSQEATKPLSIPEKNAYGIAHMQKGGLKYGLFKFFTAMFGVLISAAAIFFGLKFYKKISLKHNVNDNHVDYDKNLESPKDFKETINLFLDKTDKS